MRTSHKILGLLIASVLSSGTAHARHYEHKEHHLGPTGLFGVTSPTDIKITKVQKGSPADGKIKVGDVIVGAGAAVFKENTRRQLADAIDLAETERAKGALTLTLKGGKKVNLQLKVLGTYSDTAPFNCPKTDAIITQTADHLVKTGKFGRLKIGLLGLLATGERKYIDVVKEAIHKADWAKPDLKLTLQGTSKAWYWGYTALLLCEYYLLTGDEYVLPAINAYAVAIAQGRDAAGLWGHRMADAGINRGKLHGRLHGYAVMNQSSLPLFISLLLADKCGVRHPELQAGIKQTGAFYASFVGRGTLPYGVHDPNAKSYNNNGMSGLAAVALSLEGNQRGAAFFSRMSTAAHNILETGHTGHFFNQMWTGLGANVAGPEATAAFFKETRWLHTLNRTWDGNFTYDGCGYKNGTFSYRGCSDAGSHLLNYCLARRKLTITGREADKSIWLKGKEVSDTIALATMDVAGKSDEELLALFGHPMPKVRVVAVWTLRAREHKLVDSIRTMVKEGTREEKLSACGYFGYKCPQETALPSLEDLASVMRDAREDTEVRATAAGALCWGGDAAQKYFNDMLKVIVADEPEDTFGELDEKVGRALTVLCPDPYKAGPVSDRKLFYAAVLKLMEHKRAVGRTWGTKLIASIPLEDFHYVGDRTLHIIEDKDLTYHSYHNLGPQTGAITVLANLNVAGGIEAAFKILNAEAGKWGFKLRMLMNVLPKYGANAKPALAKLKADPRLKNIESGRFGGMWKAMVKAIESSKEARELLSIEEAKKAGLKGKRQEE
ncbi:DUF6288 domain-containing protein [Planctomycetota bacterium]